MQAAPTLAQRYDALVASGALQRDPAQSELIAKLQALADTLDGRRASRLTLARTLSTMLRRSEAPTRGLYIWGGVGRGKTTLMDLFYDALLSARKRRAHFHAFMADVHARLHRIRGSATNGVADPVAQVAQEIAAETRVLCFDEFAVSDIADATILARLFSALFAAGVTVVATSNVEPARLYEGGRNRDLFLPFIELLQRRMDVAALATPTDYRGDKNCVGQVFFTPADARARAALDALFASLAGNASPAPTQIGVMGRTFDIPLSAGRVARFSFAQICGASRSAADYLALTQRYDAVIVDDAPILLAEQRNEARRFIMLVDVLYEAHALLALSAAAEPGALYHAAQGAEAHEFARAVSRLTEMRSSDYLRHCAARISPSA